MTDKHIAFCAKLRVQPDEHALLLESAQDLDSEAETVEESLRVLCVYPEAAPVDSGYELVDGTEVTRLPESNLYQVYVKARIFDEIAFRAAAKDAYFENWGQEDWEPETLAEALYELVLASNPNTSPVDLGFEIVDWRPLDPA